MIDDSAKTEIRRLAAVYTEREKEMELAHDALSAFVREYMVNHDMYKSLDSIQEMIMLIPGSYLRFSLYESYHELRKAIRGQDGETQ